MQTITMLFLIYGSNNATIQLTNTAKEISMLVDSNHFQALTLPPPTVQKQYPTLQGKISKIIDLFNAQALAKNSLVRLLLDNDGHFTPEDERWSFYDMLDPTQIECVESAYQEKLDLLKKLPPFEFDSPRISTESEKHFIPIVLEVGTQLSYEALTQDDCLSMDSKYLRLQYNFSDALSMIKSARCETSPYYLIYALPFEFLAHFYQNDDYEAFYRAFTDGRVALSHYLLGRMDVSHLCQGKIAGPIDLTIDFSPISDAVCLEFKPFEKALPFFDDPIDMGLPQTSSATTAPLSHGYQALSLKPLKILDGQGNEYNPYVDWPRENKLGADHR